MRILIAEDDLTSRLILQATLKKLGHEVKAVADGSEALTVLETATFSVLISDVAMPTVGGFELCQRVRRLQRAHYTYIIMLTSLGDKASHLSGMAAGADDFLVKPFDEDLLAARLVVAERILNLKVQVNELRGLLPICSLCKKVRDDRNYWHQVETFISTRTDAKFSHGYCPDCFSKLKTEILGSEQNFCI